jgi:acyl-CoA synthetase (NDP forming)
MQAMADARGAGASGAAAVERLLRPRSIAVIGVSARPGSAGHNAFTNILRGGFSGELHAVGRSGGDIEGRAFLTDIAQLPRGVDLAVLTLPAAAVHEALIACAARGVRGAVVFAAGFSEVGGAGQGAQQAIADTASAAGMALLGPNCLGYGNYVDGLSVGLFGGPLGAPARYQGREGVAVIGQSGLLVVHLRQVLEARGAASSWFVTTGNEAGLTLADVLDFLAEDPSTATIVVFAEQIRAPQAFLAAAAKALAAGKRISMLHTGKSERARITARSHTGALAGSYAAMRTAVEHAGVAVVDTLEELADVSELLTRFHEAPSAGVGVVSFSGAFCGQTHDYCAHLGLDIPPLSPRTVEALAPQLPEFAPPANPLDLTTQPAWQPELLGIGAKALLDDPAIGSVVIATPLGNAGAYLDGLLPRLQDNRKPIVWGAMGDGSAPAPEILQRLLASNLPLIGSPERALRAMAALTAYGRRRARAAEPAAPPRPFERLPALGPGPQPEWVGKSLLKAIGVAVPQGSLARTPDEAAAIAERIGYPVVLKAQAGALTHKTEAGGVILGVADADALARGWNQLHANLARARPDLALDGVLVEQQARGGGVELMIGARRDPDWGPLLLAGLGGVWAEALGDVRTMPPALPPEAIARELHALKAAPLLRGFRGGPPLDVDAAAQAAAALGRLLLTQPEILELEVNPLVVRPGGEGVTALDALVITVSR